MILLLLFFQKYKCPYCGNKGGGAINPYSRKNKRRLSGSEEIPHVITKMYNILSTILTFELDATKWRHVQRWQKTLEGGLEGFHNNKHVYHPKCELYYQRRLQELQHPEGVESENIRNQPSTSHCTVQCCTEDEQPPSKSSRLMIKRPDDEFERNIYLKRNVPFGTNRKKYIEKDFCVICSEEYIPTAGSSAGASHSYDATLVQPHEDQCLWAIKACEELERFDVSDFKFLLVDEQRNFHSSSQCSGTTCAETSSKRLI